MLAQTDKDNAPREKCTICKRVLKDAEYKPFCSKRCSDVDLGRWLNGSYAIPTDEPAPSYDGAYEDEDFKL